jgi:membrane protein
VRFAIKLEDIRLKSRPKKSSEWSSPLWVGNVASSTALKSLFRVTYQRWVEDNGFRMAAALAYYTMFSLAPLVVVAIAVAGFVFSQESVQTALTSQMSALVGIAGVQATQAIIRSAHKPFVGTIAGTMGVLVLLVGASGVFMELQGALNVIWRVNNQKSGFRQMMSLSWTGFLMVLTTGILLLASVVMGTMLAALGKFAGGILPSPESLLHLLDIAVSFGVATFLFAMMFKILPKAHSAWKDVWVGAAATAIMFDIGKLLITLYLGKSSIASAYGAASSLVILIAWVYYSALIFYFGAEFTKVYAEAHGWHVASRDPVPPFTAKGDAA